MSDDERIWTTSSEYYELLRVLNRLPDIGRIERNLRLAIVAACRNQWDQLSDRSQAAVLTAERYAYGEATAEELDAAKGIADIEAVERDGEHQHADLSLCGDCISVDLG